MTDDNYIQENKSYTLKKGDKVIMHTCYESTLDKYKNKEWICETDSFFSRSKEEVVFLQDFSGYFSCEYLRRI